MKKYMPMFFTLIVVISAISFAQVPKKISYQGLLTTGEGSPIADGNYDLKFDIFNLPSGGTLRHTETQAGVPVQRGAFSVILGSVTPLTMSFNESVYVEVTVVTGPPGPSYPLTFSPRSELTSAPYALQSISLLGPNSIATAIGTNAGGSYNRARGIYSTVSGGGGATLADSNSASGDYSTIGGGGSNQATAQAATVGGGGANEAIGQNATVGGGFSNSASSAFGTVAGGYNNTANTTLTSTSSTVGGGYQNTASNNSTVGGGEENRAIGTASTIGGGYNNVANGDYAAIPGGANDSASGYTSFAAGWNAKARHHRTFVWSDGANFGSTDTNQFLIHAKGGVGIGTTTPGYLLQVGNSGDGTQARANAWNTFSDLRFKRNIEVIEHSLEKVARLRGVSFDWEKSGDHSLGFIAQEVESVLPEIVATDKSGCKSLDYGKVIPVLVEAIKEQQKEIEELRAMIKSITRANGVENKDIGQLK